MKERLTGLMAGCLEKGADYADIRVKTIDTESLSLSNGKVKAIKSDISTGFGIRVFYGGSWGFAASSDFDKLEETASRAFDIAKASTLLQKTALVLAPKPAVVDHYVTPIEQDPFTVPLSEKIALLMDCEKEMKSVEGVIQTQSSMDFRREDAIYCDSCGSYITQKLYQSGGGISATAAGGGGAETRSYPASMRGSHAKAGYEFLLSMDLRGHAGLIARESVQLLTAMDCPSGLYDVILDSSQMAMQIHESVGHPTELDRILGYEAAYAGTSFVRIDDVKEGMVYGSPQVTVVADATYPGGLGTFGYDDEGVGAKSTTLVNKGILENFTTSRETAGKIGQESNGACLADGWRHSPLVRMTNINLLAGSYELDELIAGIEDGFLMSVTKSWSIDDKRINFQFACEIAYEIKGGRKTGRVFKNPIYSGITTQFWKSCDGVANEKYWFMNGTPFCGKGQPDQTARVGHGSSPARFRKVKVGVDRVVQN